MGAKVMKIGIAAAGLFLLAGCGDTKAGGSVPLDKTVVRQVVGKLYSASEPGTMIVNDWKTVVIAPPHAAKAGEVQSVSPGATLYPVTVSLTQTLSRNGSRTTNDIRQDYLFYRDRDGDWAASATADASG
jgi:hypothetical protein